MGGEKSKAGELGMGKRLPFFSGGGGGRQDMGGAIVS